MKLLRFVTILLGLCGCLAFGDFLTVSPSITYGGQTPFPTVTVTLPAPAPAGGTVVKLSRSNTTFSDVAAKLTIPEGSTTATTHLTTYGPETDTVTVVHADGAGQSGEVTVHILAPQLNTFTVNKTSLPGGTSAKFVFKVTLHGRASVAGCTVNLESSSSDLTIPGTVFIPSGANYATFEGVPSAVYGDTTVHVKATMGSVTLTNDVKILAPRVADLTTTPQNLYGGTGVGSTLVVNLTSPAPTDGLDIPLTNDQPSWLITPSSIHVNGGSTRGANSAAAPNAANARVKATLTATYGVTKTGYIYVNPAEVSALELSPVTVAGGSHSTATVKLNGAAGSLGRKVTLSSSNSSVAHFASTTVTVHSGYSTANVDVITEPVSSDTQVTLSAMLVKTATAVLNVDNPKLTGLVLDKSGVAGGSGSVVMGTVTIDQPAGSNGVTVTLGSSNTSVATVPATVTVPSGETQMGFVVTHYVVTTQKQVTIKASRDGVAKARFLAVKPTSGPWRKFHGDNRNTGRGVSSSSTGVFKWKFKTGGGILSSPSLGADGTVYVGSIDGALYGINSNGTQKFKFTVATPKPIYSSPLAADDGFVYVGGQSGSRLFKVNPSTVTFTSFRTSDWVDSSPAMASDGTIYFGSNDEALYALNSGSLTQKWRYLTGNFIDFSSPALSRDENTVYIGSGDHKVYAFDRSGGVTWSYTTGNDVNCSPAIDSELDTVYIGSDDGYLYALNGTTGALKWKYQTGNIIRSCPAIGNDGTVYFGSVDHYVYALDGSTGALKWKYQTGDSIWSSPAVSDDDVVYIGSLDGKLYALDGGTGTLKWSYQTGGAIQSSPSIGPDGTIYIGSNDTYLYAIK